MNKNLKDNVYDIPLNILNTINFSLQKLNGKYVYGVKRAKKLLNDKKVNYGQLKKIIHELKNMDKIKDNVKYNLAGGDSMLIWSQQFLQGERDIVSSRKKSRKNSDEIGGIERNNSYLKKHNKKTNFKIPTNLIKSNSEKTSVSGLVSNGIFEEINKIKKLISY